MANLVVTIIALASFLTVVISLLQGTLGPQAGVSESWKFMRALARDMKETDLEEVDMQVRSGGADLRLAARNTGNTSVLKFDNWDVIAHYKSSTSSSSVLVKRLTYTSAATPGDNEWNVRGIYRDAVDEVGETFGQDQLDPLEEIVIQARLQPAAATSTVGQLLVSTGQGVTLSAQFTH
ncbi:MAG: hypothetical protein HY678_03815 [Chloroflexi bacterium]|nr:hypothetical protein [Chloroflexota bacterium]